MSKNAIPGALPAVSILQGPEQVTQVTARTSPGRNPHREGFPRLTLGSHQQKTEKGNQVHKKRQF